MPIVPKRTDPLLMGNHDPNVWKELTAGVPTRSECAASAGAILLFEGTARGVDHAQGSGLRDGEMAARLTRPRLLASAHTGRNSS
jgi:hypothetical protein